MPKAAQHTYINQHSEFLLHDWQNGKTCPWCLQLNKYKWQNKRYGMWEKPKREPFNERRREQKKSISTKLKRRLENKLSALTRQKSYLFPLWLTCWLNGSPTKNIEFFKNLSLIKSKKKIQSMERVPIWDLVCSFTAEGCNDTTN